MSNVKSNGADETAPEKQQPKKEPGSSRRCCFFTTKDTDEDSGTSQEVRLKATHTPKEDSSERQQEIVTRVNNHEPVAGIPIMNKQPTENKFCPAKAVDDVNKTNDKTPNDESLHDTSTDTIQKRSMKNISFHKPSVDQTINENSAHQSHDANSIVNESTPVKTGQSESSIEGENKKAVVDALKETGETWWTAEQLPGNTANNLVTRKVHNKHEEELPVSQTECDETSDCKTTYLGGMEVTSDKTVEDNQNNGKETSDCKATYLGGTEVTSDKTVEDNQNKGKETSFDKTSDFRTESDQEQYLGHTTFNSSDKNMEEFVEDSRKGEHLTGLTISSLETNTRDESGNSAYKLLRDSGRPTEDKPIHDLNMTEMDDPHGFERNEVHTYVERQRNEDKGQDSANVQQNAKTEPANDQEEKLPTVAQTPHRKLPDVSTIQKEDEIPKGKTSTDKPKKRAETMKPTPVGLQNLGNTCFFNAVMQNLNQSFLLYEVLAEKGYRLSLTKSMLEFYKQMCSGTSTVNPRNVLNNVCKRSPRFAGGRQQDSHELLRHLLDGLRNEERETLGNPNNRKVLTKVDKVFGGHFMTVYTCKDCKTPYHVCEPMLDISLPIAYEDFRTDEESSINEEDNETSGDGVMYQKVAESMMTPLAVKQKKEAQDNRSEYDPEAEDQQPSKKKKKNGKGKVQHSATKESRTEGRSILDCLNAFTRTEHIANEYLCMTCHAERVNQGAADSDYQMTSAKKRTLIYNPPALLTLHLKRFEQTPRGFVKCDNSISFEDMIDIGPHCSSWCMRNEGNETSIWYSLYGVVEHSGSLDGGHYVAYIKLRETEANIRQFLQESYLDRDQLTEEKLVEMMKQMHGLHKPNQSEKWQPKPVNGHWFYISDSHIREVSEDEVWRQQAYLLFYERRQGKNRSNRRTPETHV